MTGTPLHSVAVVGVAVDGHGRVLVIRRRDNGMWQAPGGVLELGERFEDGVVREVLEETGVRVEVERLAGVYKNLVKNVVSLAYRCRAVAGAPTPTDESSEVLWLPVADALDRMPPAHAIRVDDAFRTAAEPASRAHDGVDLRP